MLGPVLLCAHDDVRRFNIAVDDAVGVGVVQRAGQLVEQPQRALGRQGFGLGQDGLQRPALQPLQRDKRLAGVHAKFVDDCDVRMPQVGDGGCFAMKAGQHPGIVPHVRREHLQGNQAVE